MPELSRQQILVWSAVGLVILMIGGSYLRSHLSSPASEKAFTVATLGLKQEGPAVLKIHIVGAVARPGLYELKPGSRAADAIDAAGGATAAADLSQVNLAAKLADGQQLVVPEAGAAAAAPAGRDSAAPGAAGPVSINSATADQLTQLDGVGPKTAQKIIDYREAHGGFKNIEELMEVPGIGPAKFEQIKNQVTL